MSLHILKCSYRYCKSVVKLHMVQEIVIQEISNNSMTAFQNLYVTHCLEIFSITPRELRVGEGEARQEILLVSKALLLQCQTFQAVWQFYHRETWQFQAWLSSFAKMHQGHHCAQQMKGKIREKQGTLGLPTSLALLSALMKKWGAILAIYTLKVSRTSELHCKQ